MNQLLIIKKLTQLLILVVIAAQTLVLTAQTPDLVYEGRDVYIRRFIDNGPDHNVPFHLVVISEGFDSESIDDFWDLAEGRISEMFTYQDFLTDFVEQFNVHII